MYRRIKSTSRLIRSTSCTTHPFLQTTREKAGRITSTHCTMQTRNGLSDNIWVQLSNVSFCICCQTSLVRFSNRVCLHPSTDKVCHTFTVPVHESLASQVLKFSGCVEMPTNQCIHSPEVSFGHCDSEMSPHAYHKHHNEIILCRMYFTCLSADSLCCCFDTFDNCLHVCLTHIDWDPARSCS